MPRRPTANRWSIRSFAVAEFATSRGAAGRPAAWLRETQKLDPIAVGHRVVHGGPKYDGPVLDRCAVLADLERYIRWRRCTSRITWCRSVPCWRASGLPQVACFDTAFHRGHDAVADHYAIPECLYAEGVRRYGFHGLSYEYIAGACARSRRRSPSGASSSRIWGAAPRCARLPDGRSVESTMGFTALDGLPMGTRPGQIDPGVLLYLFRKRR